MNVWYLDGTIYIKHSEGRLKVITQEGLDAEIARFTKTKTVTPTVAKIPASSEVKKVVQASDTSHKSAVDLSDQMNAYNNPLRRSIKW